MFEPHFQRTQNDRIDPVFPGAVCHNESSKFPGHEKRMQGHIDAAHREKVKNWKIPCNCDICMPTEAIND